MEALVTGTREALTAQESSTRDLHKRTQISDALRLLKQHEASLPKAYPMACWRFLPKALAMEDEGRAASAE